MRPAPAPSASEGCLLCQPWWFDATAGAGRWAVAQASLGAGRSVSLPYVMRKQFGFRILTQPPLSLGGPLFSQAVVADRKRLAIEKDLLTDLIAQLPEHDAFNQHCHHSVTNWLPFYWRGFEQRTRYTYRIECLRDLARTERQFLPGVRGDIRKAERRFGLRIEDNRGIERFLDLNDLTFSRQGKRPHYDRGLVRRLDAACQERGCRRIFFAEAPDGRIHAAVYLVWDDHSAYYLMGGSDPALRNSGALSFALWEAIRFASTVTRSFDFEGSVIESVERHFRAFGATQTPYLQIWRFKSPLLRVGFALRESIRSARRR